MIDPDNTFFFSDPHFDHRNIIKYCDRPFKSIDEMNDVILRNYLATVRPDSTVFFLGDMSFGWGSHSAMWWLNRLKMNGLFSGGLYYIKGSHDNGIYSTNTQNCYHNYVLNNTLMLVHNPQDIPRDWRDWSVHGHTHSRQLVDRQHKRVCVCVEATDYKPVSLARVNDAVLISSKKEEKDNAK